MHRAQGITFGDPLRGYPVTDNTCMRRAQGITFGDPLRGYPVTDNTRMRRAQGITFGDPLRGYLQTIALSHAPRCMRVFLFSVIPHPGKPGSVCCKIKNLFRLGRNRSAIVCGERGIRTPGPVARTTVFKTAAIDHSAISPFDCLKIAGNPVSGCKYNLFLFFPPE